MTITTDIEVFDRVADHLLSQGKRSTDRNGCLYRTEDGLRCAVGCLISDEYYSELLERHDVHEGVVARAVAASLPSWDHDFDEVHSKSKKMLELLQSLHDSMSIEYWEVAIETYRDMIFVEEELDLYEVQEALMIPEDCWSKVKKHKDGKNGKLHP